MKEILYPLLTLLCLLLRLLRHGGAKSIVAENILLKQQLVIVSRCRETQKACRTGFLSFAAI